MILPPAKDRGIVVFLIWNSLPYRLRLGASLGLAAAGLALQALTLRPLPGLFLMAAATLLLLVRGYNNRVDFGKFDPSSRWEKVPRDRIDSLFELERRMRRWDRTPLDGTNALGAFVLVAMTATLGATAALSQGPLQILALDLLVLLLPHWLTGDRLLMRQPKLMKKAQILRGLLQSNPALATGRSVEVLMLLRGGKVPTDIKFKVQLPGAPPPFLGLYGQLVLNDVNGTSYPYFYTVLVAKKGFGLRSALADYHPPKRLLSEFKLQEDVEVLVLRQETTRTSGYHTPPRTMNQILAEALRLAEDLTTSSRPGPPPLPGTGPG